MANNRRRSSLLSRIEPSEPPNHPRPSLTPCPTCGQGPLVTWFTMHGRDETGSHWLFKVYCCACRGHFRRVDSGALQVVPPPNDIPSHVDLLKHARRTLDRQNERIAEQRRRARAWVYAPVVDENKSRFSQFFTFVCPFCSHTEQLGVWYTSRTCPKCQYVIQVHCRPT